VSALWSPGIDVGHLVRECRAILAAGRSTALESAMQLTAVYRKVPEGYIAFVEELPGANTQGASLDEARANLLEAVELVLEANRALSEESIQGQDVIREPFVIAVQ
jgi:predicted RNase H-like HicB family nuclease